MSTTKGNKTMFTVTPKANVNGTSFHDTTINISPATMERVFGKPACVGYPEDKVQLEWLFTNTKTKKVFTVYDWKNYHMEIRGEDFGVEFHVGSMACANYFDTVAAEEELVAWIKNVLATGTKPEEEDDIHLLRMEG